MRRYLLNTLVVFVLLLSPLAVHADQHFSAEVAHHDPPSGVELDAYDKLYFKIDYKSDDQVRFKIVPLRNGLEVDYGLMTSSTMLWPSGEKDAFAWVSFSVVTRIDEIQIVALDVDWNKIGKFGTTVDTVWSSEPVETAREPAEWVKKMIRKNRMRQEFAFDPNPQRKDVVYDTFFYVSVVTIPFFLIFQVQFLRLWRGRWRELAAIPLISVTPLIFMAILGLGIELRVWIIFIFRGMPLALFYLLVLWFARWMTERKETSE